MKCGHELFLDLFLKKKKKKILFTYLNVYRIYQIKMTYSLYRNILLKTDFYFSSVLHDALR